MKSLRLIFGCVFGAICALPGHADLTCDATDIGATSPHTRLRATWTPNTYNISWYENKETLTPLTVQSAAQTCTYGSNLVIPSTAPTKLGHTFIGWEVESNPLLGLDASINGTEPPVFAAYLGEEMYPDAATVAQYGLEQDTFVLNFSYGDIYVESSCNSTSTTFGGPASSGLGGSDSFWESWIYSTYPSGSFTRGGDGSNCWCRVYGYKPNGGTMQSVSSTPWVEFGTIGAKEHSCSNVCLEYCFELSYEITHLREALYGQQSSVLHTTQRNTQCGLSSLDTSIGISTQDANNTRWKSINSSNAYTMQEKYGTENSADLNNGEWEATFSYGTVKGVATCNSTKPIGFYNLRVALEAGRMTESQAYDALWGTNGYAIYPSSSFNTSSSGSNCWCRVTSYTPNGGSACSTTNSAWVYVSESNKDCEQRCAFQCSLFAGSSEGVVTFLRSALYSTAQ